MRLSRPGWATSRVWAALHVQITASSMQSGSYKSCQKVSMLQWAPCNTPRAERNTSLHPGDRSRPPSALRRL